MKTDAETLQEIRDLVDEWREYPATTPVSLLWGSLLYILESDVSNE